MNIFKAAVAAAILGIALTVPVQAQLASYSQDFDGLDINGTEIGAGWIFFNNVFDGETYLFGYGGAAPNGENISGLVDNERDPGTQQLSVFSDYNCCSPDTGHISPTGIVETNVFQEQTVLSCNVGQTWTFTFDAKLGNLEGASTATAFIKVLDPLTGYSTTASVTADMTVTPADWDSYELELLIDDWDGQILQFGFQNTAGGFEGSSVFYDNVAFSGLGSGICPFSDDFESYADQEPDVLGDAGYLVFGNVSDPDGVPTFSYGPFPAPNQSGAFSGVSVGEGGPEQGAQQLNTFSDYNNLAHLGGNLVEAIVYREQTIGAANVGQTWEFSFDAKLGNLLPPTTALAFIKTIDPNAGFATTNFVSVDTTSTPASWSSYDVLSLAIDASLVGQLIQIGFSNTATNFDPSGVFYDNIAFEPQAGSDADGDGVDDSTDNCINVANPLQQDSNADGIGNICDADIARAADLLGDCFVNFSDLNRMKAVFFTNNADADLDSSGFVNFTDLDILKAAFFQAPGPSANACTPGT